MPESKIKVETGVPVPPSRRGRPPLKYPWLEMMVGDSFFVPDTTQKRISGSSAAARKRYGTRYIMRTVTENVDGQPVRGVRVWRVE